MSNIHMYSPLKKYTSFQVMICTTQYFIQTACLDTVNYILLHYILSGQVYGEVHSYPADYEFFAANVDMAGKLCPRGRPFGSRSWYCPTGCLSLGSMARYSCFFPLVAVGAFESSRA